MRLLTTKRFERDLRRSRRRSKNLDKLRAVVDLLCGNNPSLPTTGLTASREIGQGRGSATSKPIGF